MDNHLKLTASLRIKLSNRSCIVLLLYKSVIVMKIFSNSSLFVSSYTGLLIILLKAWGFKFSFYDNHNLSQIKHLFPTMNSLLMKYLSERSNDTTSTQDNQVFV